MGVMTVNVIAGLPPMIDEIDAAFHCRDQDVFYSWGDRIFSSHGQVVHPALQAHEQVHCERQLVHPGGVVGWWRVYIANPVFRLREEVLAHRAEYLWWADRPGADRPVTGFRSARLYHLTHVAKRLASPLYGNLITLSAAKQAIERK
jgi:hypothetical protein